MDCEEKLMEIYLHIPFCVRKCLYCDFLSGPADKKTQEAYLGALLGELSGRSGEYAGRKVCSVFIGGGTPSAVDAVWIRRLMEAVRAFYALQEGAEVTLEVNPGTVTGESLALYAGAGINRLSIGLQSAWDSELALLGRIHDRARFEETYRLAREAGFSNINVDLMSALPGQSPESWRGTLRYVTGLTPPPEHISAYSLILEEGTPFYEMYRRGELEPADEDTDREMYEFTGAYLEAQGYRRYEISNYAREGFCCRHNVGYWIRRDYAGFGIGAASLISNVRFSNGRDLEAYCRDPLGVREQVQRLSQKDQREEFVFLGLRLTEGVSERCFAAQFGRELEAVYGDVIEKFVGEGLLEWSGEEPPGGRGRFLRLTARGLDLSNYVMAGFLR